MPKKFSTELLPFNPETERTLFKRKKEKDDNTEMENHNSDRFSKSHSNHNEMLGLREPTHGNCWRPMMNEDYSEIRHQSIDTNNFELKPALINMVQQQQFGGSPSEDPNRHLLIIWHN